MMGNYYRSYKHLKSREDIMNSFMPINRQNEQISRNMQYLKIDTQRNRKQKVLLPQKKLNW